jgi:hypothetical protein
MAWYTGAWVPKCGARCSRKDDPRHEGVIVSVTGAPMTDRVFIPHYAVVRWDSGIKSMEYTDDLCEAGDDSHWYEL